MPTRYQQLRDAIAILAAPADEQAAHLDQILSPVTGGGSAAIYGNDELALDLEAAYSAAGHMLEYGEITQAEIEAAAPLWQVLLKWSGKANGEFWTREALFKDPRWQEVRQLALDALKALPDEERESEWARNLQS
jgi:hypothetical protein